MGPKGREGFALESNGGDAGSGADGGGVSVRVAAAGFDPLGAFGLQLAEIKTATNSREQLALRNSLKDGVSPLLTVTEPP
jgi:hypothetical protein